MSSTTRLATVTTKLSAGADIDAGPVVARRISTARVIESVIAMWDGVVPNQIRSCRAGRPPYPPINIGGRTRLVKRAGGMDEPSGEGRIQQPD